MNLLNWSSKLRDNNGRKTPLISGPISNNLVESYFFLENYVTSEGTFDHNVLYYQQLSIACYQV